jgi:hypothetical protein
MPQPRRLLAITTAMFAVGGFAVAIGGCASKPPQPEPESAAATSEAASASKSSNDGASRTGSAEHAALAPEEGQTSEERRAALDKRLIDSLDSFDAKLRGEQQRIARDRDARQTAVVTVAGSDSSGTNDGQTSSGAASRDDANGNDSKSHDQGSNDVSRKGTESRSAHAGDLKSDQSAAGSSAGNGAVANEIPDGNDDDVIARRLRKAAEQETDPELKEKLWKEYVEYKKNTQGK